MLSTLAFLYLILSLVSAESFYLFNLIPLVLFSDLSHDLGLLLCAYFLIAEIYL